MFEDEEFLVLMRHRQGNGFGLSQVGVGLWQGEDATQQLRTQV